MKIKGLSRYDIREKDGEVLVWSHGHRKFCKPVTVNSHSWWFLTEDDGRRHGYGEGRLRYLMDHPDTSVQDLREKEGKGVHFTKYGHKCLPDGRPRKTRRVTRLALPFDANGRDGKLARFPSVATYGRERMERLDAMGKRNNAHHYRQMVARFRTDMGRDIALAKIGRDTLETWVARMQSAGLAVNTINYYFRTLRALYRRALDEGLFDVEKDPFDRVKVRTEATVKRALTREQIHRLATMRLERPNLGRARDMWMLSFYLQGMPPVDLWRFRPYEIENGVYTYRRTKTNSAIRVGVCREAMEIIDRYTGVSGIMALPNRDKVNHGLKEIGRRLGLPFPLSMYCARHSWATMMQNVNAPVGVISQGMGHASQETTRIYLAGIQTSEVDKWSRKAIEAIKM